MDMITRKTNIMTKTTAAEALVALNEYTTLYQKKYLKSPKINRYRDKYAMIDVLDSLGEQETLDLIRYYFTTAKVGHPLQFFFYNYERLEQARQQRIEDHARTQRLLEETQKRVEESILKQQLSP